MGGIVDMIAPGLGSIGGGGLFGKPGPSSMGSTPAGMAMPGSPERAQLQRAQDARNRSMANQNMAQRMQMRNQVQQNMQNRFGGQGVQPSWARGSASWGGGYNPYMGGMMGSAMQRPQMSNPWSRFAASRRQPQMGGMFGGLRNRLQQAQQNPVPQGGMSPRDRLAQIFGGRFV